MSFIPLLLYNTLDSFLYFFYYVVYSRAAISAWLLQSSLSHDSSEIIIICWFDAQGDIWIIISVENGCAA